MSFLGRRRIICFKTDIKNDPAMLGSMRLQSIQRYYHSRHNGDYMFASDYNSQRLKDYFAGQMCEVIDIFVHKAEPYVAIKKTLGAFSDALSMKTPLRREFLRQEGSSGRVYRAFINNYFKLTPGERYLELGANDGTAFTAALHGNNMEALAVDDWNGKEDVRDFFMSNLLCVDAPASRFGMLDKNLGEVFPAALAPRTAMFCHRSCLPEPGMLDAILAPAPGRPALLVLDAWNFPPRRQDWLELLEQSGLEPALSISVRSSLDDIPSIEIYGTRWAAGYYIALLTPRERAPGAA